MNINWALTGRFSETPHLLVQVFYLPIEAYQGCSFISDVAVESLRDKDKMA